MCYAIPGKVKEVGKKLVVIDYFGESKKAINEFYDVHIGDYVCAQGGFVIKKVSPPEAESILSAWQELFFELKKIDLRLSRLDLEKEGIDKKLSLVLDRVLESTRISREDLRYLFNMTDRRSLELIYKAANFLRQKYIKNSCCVHGIIEISNYCSQGCMYCGISGQNKDLTRYRMTHQEIVDTAIEAIEEFGFKALVLQSGEDSFYSAQELASIVKEIKERAGVLICISFGEIGIAGLERLYEAGARAILMRFETSNPEIYEKLHPGRSLNTRLEQIRKAREIGYLIMTGGLIGLPGQTKEDIISDIYLAKDLGAQMYSFGPFLPDPKTPLAKEFPPNEDDILKTLALTRLIDPEKAKILVTTAFETLYPDARRKGLLSGANSVMLNLTPIKYRQLYSIYPNRVYDSEEINNQIKETIALLQSLGRAPTDLGVG